MAIGNSRELGQSQFLVGNFKSFWFVKNFVQNCHKIGYSKIRLICFCNLTVCITKAHKCTSHLHTLQQQLDMPYPTTVGNGNYDMNHVANLLPSPIVIFFKSVNICQSYKQISSGTFLWITVCYRWAALTVLMAGRHCKINNFICKQASVYWSSSQNGWIIK